MPHLVVSEPGRVSFTLELKDGLAIGRDSVNDLVVSDKQASRRHARLEQSSGGYRVVDLGSTHGTFVNGERAGERVLADQDQVQIGNVLLLFRAAPLSRAETVYGPTDLIAPARHDSDARRLGMLYEVSRVIGLGLAPGEMVARMLEAAREVLGCDRALVGLADGRSGGGRRITAGGDVVVSQANLEALLARRERFRADEPGLAAMGVPLLAGDRVLGFIYVERPGAFSENEVDFLTVLAHLLAALIARGEEMQRLGDVAAALRAANPRAEMLGESEQMAKLRAQIANFATADVAVLIRGESGTGKELVANAIHALSARADGPFVAVNCAAIPEALVESELFGHERGAFSGAVKKRRGRFALAHRGTIFLDEIGDLSPASQAKILRVLEDGEVVPVGGEESERVDVRVLSATHKPLESEIAAGRFREDLYYRLNVGEVRVPALRDRGDDVVLLARAFLERAALRMGRRCPQLGPAAVDALRRYGWPGNVRQLHNEMERALILAGGDVIDALALRAGPSPARADEPSGSSWEKLQAERSALDENERRVIAEALRAAGGVVAKAARDLGVPRTTLASRLLTLGISADDK
jgi:Nif-specific regulatory protein